MFHTLQVDLRSTGVGLLSVRWGWCPGDVCFQVGGHLAECCFPKTSLPAVALCPQRVASSTGASASGLFCPPACLSRAHTCAFITSLFRCV